MRLYFRAYEAGDTSLNKVSMSVRLEKGNGEDSLERGRYLPESVFVLATLNVQLRVLLASDDLIPNDYRVLHL